MSLSARVARLCKLNQKLDNFSLITPVRSFPIFFRSLSATENQFFKIPSRRQEAASRTGIRKALGFHSAIFPFPEILSDFAVALIGMALSKNSYSAPAAAVALLVDEQFRCLLPAGRLPTSLLSD
jgi:hypothetical protein